MSRVANNLPTTSLKNGFGPTTKANTNRSSSNGSLNSIANEGRGFNIRSAAPPPVQKETVHACPLCNSEYKDPRVLPCTHTYCYNCIRDKLMKNARIMCPRCHHQVQPFDENNLEDLPPNLILSQKWRIGARPMPTVPMAKTSVPYKANNSTSVVQSIAPNTETARQQDKSKSNQKENNEYEKLTNGTHSNRVSSIVDSSVSEENNRQSLNSTNESSAVPIVSNLIKIFSEARPVKTQQSINEAKKLENEELTKIYKQIINQNQQRTKPQTNDKEQSHPYEEVYEEITWDNLVHGSTPVAPPFPEQLQSATTNNRNTTDLVERSMPTTTSNHETKVEHLRDVFVAIQNQIPDKTPSIQQIPINGVSLNGHLTTPLRIQSTEDEGIHENDKSHHQNMNGSILRTQHSRQPSNTESVHSGISDSISRPSTISPVMNNNETKFHDAFTYQLNDDKISPRTISTSSLSRRSLENFPPPPQNLDMMDTVNNNDINKQRPTSSLLYRSSINDGPNEQMTGQQSKLMRNERVNPEIHSSPTNQRSSSSRISSNSPNPPNLITPLSAERDTNYSHQPEAYLSSSSVLPTNLTSRVDLLLSDQKRLEREIEEQIRRLKYDFDDVRKQIGRKESSIHREVKSIATRLDSDITEHYHRKQKIYADLAADANTLGSELERLKTNTNNNKQQLWTNLEQIETNIRNIRRAVEQQKEPHCALTFSEGQRVLAADTIGQITYNETEPNQRYTVSPTRQVTTSSSHANQPSITSLSPFKYFQIDHLSTLEPEAIAITEDNKKILLGICNKLFILNEFGEPLKTLQLTPSIRGIAISKKYQSQHIAYISHGDIVSMIDIDSGQTLDCVKETDSSGESGTFLPLGIDTDNIHGHVYVCDYRNSCVIKFDDKLEFMTQWRIYNHSDQYDEARPKLISAYGHRLYIIIEHSCKPYYNQGIAYTFSLHICDTNTGNVIKIVDAESLSTERLRWPCSVQAINNDKCFILDTMTSGKYFNGQWQRHWSRVLEIGQNDTNLMRELFQLDSEAAAMTTTKQTMVIAANGEILFVDLGFLQQQQQQKISYDKHYQNLS